MHTSTQITSSAQPGQHVEFLEKRKWYKFFLSPLWLCLLIAFGIRVFLIIHTHSMIEGDEALVGIQAQHILRGDFPIYYYAQPYMGSLEAYFAAILFALFGPSVWALRLVGTLLSLLIVWLTWRLAGVLAESAKLSKSARLTFKIVAALCAAIPPLYDGVLELHMLGGYIETFFLMILLLLCAFQLTRRWRDGASYPELIWRWVGIGFVVGLGLWVDPLIASAVLAAGCWILGNCILEMWKRKRVGADIAEPWWRPACELLFVFAALPSILLGMAPALWWGATHQWANVAYIFFNLSGNETHRQKILNTLDVTRSFGLCVSPRLIGGALPIEGLLSLDLHVCLFIIGLVSIATTCLLLLWTCFHPQSRLASVRQLAGLPALFALCSICLYCGSSASTSELLGCSNDFAGRYAVPTMLALPFFFATPFTLSWFSLLSKDRPVHTTSTSTISSAKKTQSFWHHKLIIFSQSLLLLLLFGFLGTQALTYKLTNPGETYQSNYCIREPFDNGPILAYLQKQRIRYFWADSFLGYPLVFKSNLSIIGSNPQALTSAGIDRIPSYTDAVLHANRPSILAVVPHEDLQPLVLQTLDKLHVTYHTARFYDQPGYDVLVITPISRTVSPLELTHASLFGCFAK